MRILALLSLFCVSLIVAQVEDVQPVVLAEHLDLSEFAGRVSVCPAPLVAHNNSCTCAVGWTWLGATCVMCPTGSYKTEAGFGACSACPTHMTSFEGASAISDCMCDRGFMPHDGACVACLSNAYKSFIGNNSCVSCPLNAHTSLAGTKTDYACVCDDGYMLEQNSTQEQCVACPDNYFSNAFTKSTCVPCAANSISQSPASLCQCAPGYAKQDNDVCTPCAPGTYKNVNLLNLSNSDIGDSRCERCPLNMSSHIGSRDIKACWCLAGFERHDALTCVPCTANAFCPGLDAKIACPLHSSSATGAKTINECICDEGFFWYDEACVLCGEGFFCSQGTRSQCPAKSTSVPGSTHVGNCTCFAGFQNLETE